MRAVSYARVSTDGQEQNASLPHQKKANQELADKLNLQIAESFEDIASGTLFDQRQGLQSALASLQQGSVFLVFSLDRLGRSDGVTDDIIREIYQRGGVLGVSREGTVYKTLNDVKLNTYWSSRASTYEWLTIKARTDVGKLAHLNAGSYIWKPYYGYALEREKIDGVNANRLVVKDEEAQLVRQALKMLSEGKTQLETTRIVNEAFGTTLTITAIRTFYKNRRVYAGKPFTKSYTVDGDRRSYEHTAPPLIDDAMLRELDMATFKSPGRKHKGRFNRVFCTCGEQALVLSTNRRGVQSYGCSSLNRERVNKNQGREYTPTSCRKTVSFSRIEKKLLHFVDHELDAHLRTLEEEKVYIRQDYEETQVDLRPIRDQVKLYTGELDKAIEAGTVAVVAPYIEEKLKPLLEELESLEKLSEELHKSLQQELPKIDREAARKALEEKDYRSLVRLFPYLEVTVSFATGEIEEVSF